MNPDMGAALDPFAAWRTMRDSYLDVWSKAMIDTVNSDAYAQAMGSMLDSYLNASLPFQDAMQKSMTQVLTGLNMPTRSDVTGLAERLTNIEVRLDDLDVRLDDVVQAASRLNEVSAKLDRLLEELQSRGQGEDGAAKGEDARPARVSRSRKES